MPLVKSIYFSDFGYPLQGFLTKKTLSVLVVIFLQMTWNMPPICMSVKCLEMR